MYYVCFTHNFSPYIEFSNVSKSNVRQDRLKQPFLPHIQFRRFMFYIKVRKRKLP
jgi:hypothetical protein